MFNESRLLDSCQKILGSESNLRVGMTFFSDALKKTFPSLKWAALEVRNGLTAYYHESLPSKKEVDLLIYANVETTNPSQISLWSETDHDPLSITFKSGKIFGLGAEQEKVTFVSQVYAYSQIEELYAAKDINVLLVASYGRESKMQGAKRIMREVVKGRKIKKILLAHPTENKIKFGSSGRVKTKVFFPFCAQEKKLRKEHDLRENISSQSRIFSFPQGEELSENTIFKMIQDCKNFPSGTILLDLDGGSSSLSEPESTYFEVDFEAPFENSLVSKLSGFGDFLLDINKQLLDMYPSAEVKRAIHIGRCYDTEEGILFFGYNRIPATISLSKLDEWFKVFKTTIAKAGGEIDLIDARSPYMPDKNQDADFTVNITEASYFSKFCKDIAICGAGKEKPSRQANESITLSEVRESCEVYFSLLKEYMGEV